jgi:hypothetical protein
VSSSRQNITVSRQYRPAPDDCVRALALLLEKSVIKEGGPATIPKNAKVRSKNDSCVVHRIP